MSKFFLEKYSTLDAYVPGEQPQDRKYLKLNTNESPYPPSLKVLDAAFKEASRLNLYSDPESKALTDALASSFGVGPENILVTNGSDEALNFAFMAFCDSIVFPAVTYGFYPVIANLNGIPYREIPVTSDFRINVDDYIGIGDNIVIANPNAPTGICLSDSDIERIVAGNPGNIVIIDEAYVDFGAESVVPLTKKYDNLIVTQTFSKSRSLAGARLGFAIASEELINDMKTIKDSMNPYNVNRMTMAAGMAALADSEYYIANCREIEETRVYTVYALEDLGFEILPSKANFVFAKNPKISGGDLYRKLKDAGVLVRYFDKPGLTEFVRITIGTRSQMDTLIEKISEVLS